MKELKINEIPEEERIILGRTNGKLNPLTLFWTASGIEISFEGTELWAEFETDYSLYECWIDVIVDGALSQRLMLPKGKARICIFRGIEGSIKRNIRIIRDTQAMCGDPCNMLNLNSISFEGNLCPVKEYALKLEFIGDSITSGEGANGAHDEMEWIPMVFNAYREYAFMTSKKLDAVYNCISQSGWGIYCGWDGNVHNTLPRVYEDVCGVLEGDRNESLGAHTKWNFNHYNPDFVIINLGTNDNGSFDQPDFVDPLTSLSNTMRRDDNGQMVPQDLEKITNAAYNFLRMVRRCNEGSYIIWCYGMLGHELSKPLSDTVRRYSEETGDALVSFLELPDTMEDGFGSRQHPGFPSHAAASTAIAKKITSLMGR